jgi:hypothetical protein
MGDTENPWLLSLIFIRTDSFSLKPHPERKIPERGRIDNPGAVAANSSFLSLFDGGYTWKDGKPSQIKLR